VSVGTDIGNSASFLLLRFFMVALNPKTRYCQNRTGCIELYNREEFVFSSDQMNHFAPPNWGDGVSGVANHQTRVYEDILEMLSSRDNPTPLLRLNKTVPFQHTKVYAKLEWYNPFGSIKDRVAAHMVSDAKLKGLLSPEQSLVEPTSGNTGMGLAMVANANGYSLTTPLSKKIPSEKRTMLRFFGVNVEELDDDL